MIRWLRNIVCGKPAVPTVSLTDVPALLEQVGALVTRAEVAVAEAQASGQYADVNDESWDRLIGHLQQSGDAANDAGADVAVILGDP